MSAPVRQIRLLPGIDRACDNHIRVARLLQRSANVAAHAADAGRQTRAARRIARK